MIKNGHPDAEFKPGVRPRWEKQGCQVVHGDAGPSVALIRLKHSPVQGAGLPPSPGTALPFPLQGKDEPYLTNQMCTQGAPKVSTEESGNTPNCGSDAVAFFVCGFSFLFFTLSSES